MEFDLRDKIDEQYTVIEKYRGGMSVVYIVLDDFSQKRFAVKTVKEELLEDRGAVDRFAQEARTWMNLGRHEHIVEAIIYREIQGQPFLFLEYVDGVSIGDLLEAEDVLFPPQVIEYALQVCEGMQYVHAAQVGPGDSGVIHRDLKPANIMLNRQGQVKITDFGLAKVYGVATRLTDAGMGLGTYMYMPPEQFLDAASADKTSDIYSFGVALYRSLTGENPVKGESVGKLIHNILESDPPALRAHRPDLPERLDEIVLRCLRKRRGRRFQSFADLARALTDVRELVEEQYADADAYRCEQCGYRTMHSYGACPVCAGTMISMQEPEVPVGQEVRAEVEAGPAPEPAEEEIQAAEELYQRAVVHHNEGRLRQALETLRQATELRPDYEEARALLDQVALEFARSKARKKQPAYNWPMLRGNVTRSGFTPEVVVPPLVRRWQYRAGDWVLASPCVANGVAYVGVHVERAGKFGRLCAIKARNGELLWDLETRYEINTTPCVARGERLYVGSHRQMMCLDARSGQPIWNAMADDLIETSPALYEGVLYFADRSGSIYAMHADERRPLWKRETGMAVYSSPAVWQGALYVGSCDYQVRALDAAKGELLWEFATGGEVLSTPAYAQGLVFVGSCDNRLYALDAATGAKRWEFQTGAEIHSSPAVHEDLVFVGSRDGCVYAVEVRTGKKKWQFDSGDWVESSPAVSGGSLYFGSHDHKLYALEVESGVCLWHYETGGEVASSPAVSQGSVFVGSNDGSVYCFRSRQ